MLIVRDFFRYLVVGGSAFLIDISALVFFTEIIGFHYLVSAPIAYILALIFNYLLCVKWVFKYRYQTNPRVEFLIFCFVGLAGIAITEILLAVLSPLFHGNYLLAKMISCGVVLFWNFSARRYLLFRPKPS